MKEILSARILAGLDSRIAVLQVGRYLTLARVRVRGTVVECLVPTWAGLGDTLGDVRGDAVRDAPHDTLDVAREAMLVVVREVGPALSWVYIKGDASLVGDPDLEGLLLPGADPANRTDLYELVRVQPVRIEIVDEGRGWGYRETMDL